MSQVKFLTKLTESFGAAGIPYVVVGSISSSIHGIPRFTRDIDVLIQVTGAQLSALLRILGEGCYASATAANEALRNHSMFNVVDYETGWKADLILLSPEPYEHEKFGRRTLMTYEGVEVYCLAPEDVILSKLRWSAITPSERQMRDACDVARVRWDVIDFDYLRRWAATLGLSEALETLLREAENLQPPETLP
jgi:hypothetical protein